MNPTSTHSLENMQQALTTAGLNHVAIIMDGNRRWAKQKHLPTMIGHQQGVNALKAIIQYSSDIKLKALTVYAFSTENWNRSNDEVGYLVQLFVEVLKRELAALNRLNIKIRFIGDTSAFPELLQKVIEQSHKQTENNDGLFFQIAANYGARQEITNAVKTIASQVHDGRIKISEITPKSIEELLYTQQSGNPDLLIRTGGEHRLSNYLLWQCAYTELYFSDVLWPDFREDAYIQALASFTERERRYGK